MEFPEIGTYADMERALRLRRSTVYKLVSEKQLPYGVYLGHGRFNMTRLATYIEKEGRFTIKRLTSSRKVCPQDPEGRKG